MYPLYYSTVNEKHLTEVCRQTPNETTMPPVVDKILTRKYIVPSLAVKFTYCQEIFSLHSTADKRVEEKPLALEHQKHLDKFQSVPTWEN